MVRAMFTYLGHIFAFLAAVLTVAVVAYTRDRGKKHTFVYFLDTEQRHDSFSPDDWQVISSYLQRKGCPIGTPEVFNGHDIADCDARCRQYLRELTAKLSESELVALGLSPQTSFHYCAWRYQDPERPDLTDPLTGERSRVVLRGFRFPSEGSKEKQNEH